MGGRRWTRDEKSALIGFARAGDASYEIADALARTRGSVQKMAEVLGVPIAGGHWRVDPIKRGELLDWLAANPGGTLSQAARELRRHPRCVRAMTILLVRDGLIRRTGGATNACRYVVTSKWHSRKARP